MRQLRIATVVGARPQFIKAVPVSRALAIAGYRETLIHTGQHYDFRMSGIFVEELGLKEPEWNLDVRSGAHGRQTGEMMVRLERVLIEDKPDWVIVFGDTNSTLAGALCAAKLGFPVAHVEAGLRSFNRVMPEEINRVLTDHCSAALFCPTRVSVDNLAREGITNGVHLVGDVMYDAALLFADHAETKSNILQRLPCRSGEYILLTIHRPANADNPQHLKEILQAMEVLDAPVVFPVHPRTRSRIVEQGGAFQGPAISNVHAIDPVGYLDMLMLERNARLIVTDSGGVQKEAYFFRVPCVTIREETEWVETVESGWNRLVKAEAEAVEKAVRSCSIPPEHPAFYGHGDAATRLVQLLGAGSPVDDQ